MSQTNLNKIGVVILAGGKGTRLNCTDRPKVMLDLNGKPIVEYVVDTLRKMGFSDKQICLVVGFKHEVVENYFGDKVIYALQEEQLGTGHAVMMAEGVMKNKFEQIIVLPGDSPFISQKTMEDIIQNNIKEKTKVTMASVSWPNLEGDNARFFDFGRVVRDENGKVINITEKKDCTEEELKISEGNAAYYCFESKWLWENINSLKTNNVQNEYYLTDLVDIAISQNEKVESVIIPAEETVGINTLEQLEQAKKKLS
ncbi:MAG: sugar phosphate nucleotidyltransferase [Candidatus Magasanikbacteria bacterium]